MIVVTAANGRLGRAVAAELALHANPNDVRLTARTPAKILDLGGRGFDITRADYNEAASMDAAFKGADVLLLISGTTANEARIQEHRRAVDAAERAGVGRIVYTSYANPTPKSLFPFGAIHGDTEAYLASSGVPFTILRNNPYAANLDNALKASKDSSLLASPSADAKVAYVTHADCAAATVAALLGAGHAGKTYAITGPEALSYHDIAQELSAARGKPVGVIKTALIEHRAHLQSLKLPMFLVEALVGSSAATAAGEYQGVSRDAEQLMGRPAQSIREYVKKFA